jgi:hypothetical protein
VKDWSCTVEFTVTGGGPTPEAHAHLARAGVRPVPQLAGHYVFANVDTYEDYLQALLGAVGELDAALTPYGITREISGCRVVELT